jgi:hypothetical protein
MRTDVVLQVDIVVLPNDQNVPQLAGIVTFLAAGREPSGYELRVSLPDGSRRTAPNDAAVWQVSKNSRSDVRKHWTATRLSLEVTATNRAAVVVSQFTN